jgi:hypothetical protein
MHVPPSPQNADAQSVSRLQDEPSFCGGTQSQALVSQTPDAQSLPSMQLAPFDLGRWHVVRDGLV